jgi:hypothetical protein
LVSGDGKRVAVLLLEDRDRSGDYCDPVARSAMQRLYCAS